MKVYFYSYSSEMSLAGEIYRYFKTKADAIKGRKEDLKEQLSFAEDKARELAEDYEESPGPLIKAHRKEVKEGFSEIRSLEYDLSRDGIVDLLNRWASQAME